MAVHGSIKVYKQWAKVFLNSKPSTEEIKEVLWAAESGNLDMFQKLYVQDPSRLSIRDPRGRTAAHQAAFKNRISILTFIVQQEGDLNVQDNAGNTPLHVAVEAEALDAISLLLNLRVKTGVLNEKKQAPIHLAVELNKISVLDTMAKFKDTIDIQQGGEHGRTALHIAAIYDHDACAKILNMSDQLEYPEAFQFKLFDSRKFGIYVFAGVNISDTTHFLFNPITKKERLQMMTPSKSKSASLIVDNISSNSEEFENDWHKALVKSDMRNKEKGTCRGYFTKCLKAMFCGGSRCKRSFKSTKSDYSLLSTENQDEEMDDLDWWTKFYASFGETHRGDASTGVSSTAQHKLKIYANELENQPEFRGFSDILTPFEIFKGKRTGDDLLDEQLTTAVFKGSVKIYQWPPENGEDIEELLTPSGSLLKNGIFANCPANTPLNYILRIYCVRALNLRPKDPNGKSDPYLQVQLGQKIVSDREHYVPKTVNPIFGRCFEFQASFPEIVQVTLRVYDYDMTSSDDLIGETKIDLENRYYTKHRAMCGLPLSYETFGYCQWRDQKKPTEILRELCKSWGLDAPIYSDNAVLINAKKFSPVKFTPSDNPGMDHEILALETLNRWQEVPVVGFKLVPEHVETRSLYSPDKPGIEQGKLQMWIDLFPRLDNPVPERVNVTPRKPTSYELRVIIWNTEDVPLLEDDFFTGEKKSDIYVKAWLDDPANSQFTDVHYRSLTGEGNFNWRFVFKFDYLSTENKLIVKKKESLFSKDETEFKLPCALNLTVWDNDTFSKDDFLGSVTLELARMPRGARSSKKCALSILDPKSKRINLFKTRRTKGWWPFCARTKEGSTYEMGGKLEAEFEILTREDADRNPVGTGRQGPEALPPPKYGQRIHHLHYFDHGPDEEVPPSSRRKKRRFFRCDWMRNPFAGSTCACCKKPRPSRDCKIMLAVLLSVLVLFAIVMVLYKEGYIVQLAGGCHDKEKRETGPLDLSGDDGGAGGSDNDDFY